jgi:hypothetical protein
VTDQFFEDQWGILASRLGPDLTDELKDQVQYELREMDDRAFGLVVSFILRKHSNLMPPYLSDFLECRESWQRKKVQSMANDAVRSANGEWCNKSISEIFGGESTTALQALENAKKKRPEK